MIAIIDIEKRTITVPTMSDMLKLSDAGLTGFTIISEEGWRNPTEAEIRIYEEQVKSLKCEKKN